MTHRLRLPIAIILTLFFMAAPIAARPALAQGCSLTTLGNNYIQDFNTLSNVLGTTTNNLTIPCWYMTETGAGARDNEQYAVDNGSSSTGDTYSYGTSGSTDRALGGLQSGTLIPIFGALFTNNTGATIAQLNISYTGEQWRLGTESRPDQLTFEYSTNATSLDTGTWTAVSGLHFLTPNTFFVGAKDGNTASNRTARSASITGLSVPNGASFWIRWTDFNASGADDGLAVDDFSLTPQSGPTTTLSINDVPLNEGDSGTKTFTFTVSLGTPAGSGGVTFDIATADGTAAQPGDYTLKSLLAQVIPAGSSNYTFDVLVNGDLSTEQNETFFVNVTNVVGATVADGQGQGTILNDDVTLIPIHDIQGPGGSSPIVGASVTTRGIVTGVKSNGFFVQEPDASVDADPATSEGIFIFTSSTPPADAAVGNLVQVAGTVTEFVPSADPYQPPLTEITAPTVVLITAGNPLPAAVALGTSFPHPVGSYDQLERLEGMLVGAPPLTVVGPTMGSISEANATATSSGVFYGVVTGVARPFREAGVQVPDTLPDGSGASVPRFDTNPERIRVDSDGLAGQPAIDVGYGDVVGNVIGPLDYTFRTYTILPTGTLSVIPGRAATPAPLPTSKEFTVASMNLQRFFDTVDDPAVSDPVLTTTAFNDRLAKASLIIRDYLNLPDILAVQEVENLSTLQTLATQVNTDAGAANPNYVAYLVEGNDIGGIDVGFLVKTTANRITVNSVTQELDGTLFVNPDSSTETLNDRPPLRLDATINAPNSATFPLQVIVVHQRSLNGVGDPRAGSNGWATAGERVRAKRKAQAEDLANLLQARQVADPTERIIVLGDFNAFEVNDGYVDIMGTVTGNPAPGSEVVLPTLDLINPNFTNLTNSTPSAERYSYVFDGSAQVLDHMIANAALLSSASSYRLEHARVSADFPETDRNNPATPLRLSDHDPMVAYFTVDAFAVANVSISMTDTPDPVQSGGQITYNITMSNAGPDDALDADWTGTLPANTTFVSLSSPVNWTCTTPAVGATGNVYCYTAVLNKSIAAPGTPPSNPSFTLVVKVNDNVASGTTITNSVDATSTTSDPTPGDNTTGDIDTTVIAPLFGATPRNVEVMNGLIDYLITRTISVSNDGDPNTTLSVTLVSLSNPAFSVTGLPISLAEGAASAEIDITCTPQAGAPQTGTLTLATNDPARLAPTFNLTCSPAKDTIGIFRPSNGTIYARRSNTTGFAQLALAGFTSPSDQVILGDWNDDGVDSVGIFRNGQFLLRNSNAAGAPIVYTFAFGQAGDIPVAGDWDGDGVDSVGYYRPSNNRFYLRNALSAGIPDYVILFGGSGDQPVVGDWNGDNVDSVGVFRPTTARFFLSNTVCANCVASTNVQFTFGNANDVPFAGDWDNNGTDGVGVFRPSNGRTFFRNALSTGFADIAIVYGNANDRPIAGRWTIYIAAPASGGGDDEAPIFDPKRR